MPYPNEHAARQTSPGSWETYSRLHPQDWPEGIDLIRGCRTEDGETVCGVQSIRIDSSRFTVAEANRWLSRLGFRLVNEPAVDTEDDD